MSYQDRPFTAGTSKLAYAQAFSRTSPRTHTDRPRRSHLRLHWLAAARTSSAVRTSR